MKTLDLEPFKEALKIVRTGKGSDGNSYSSIDALNQAAWIGESSGILLAEIERLRLIEAAARVTANSGPLCNGLSDKNSVNALRESLGLKHI